MRQQHYSISIYADGSEPSFAPVATIACSLDDWDNMVGIDEDRDVSPRVLIVLEAEIPEPHGPPIAMSFKTALTVLPDLVANLMRKQLEAPRG